MEWKPPTFDEIKMDAEIGSYQEDHDPAHESIVVGGLNRVADQMAREL